MQNTGKWWHNAVVYQIYPRSFCDANNDGIGDLAGIISKLDYLQRLGINIIWLSPVYQSPMDDNGYDISDYQNIAAEFGTLDEMETLIAEAKKRDIQIVMDLVVNHTSDEHPWFIEAKKSKDNPYRHYYIWRKPKDDGSVPNNFHSYFGGSGWEFDEESGEYYFHQFSKRQPDLNWENSQVQAEIHKMMNWWLDKGIGGFRMDVIDLIGKDVDNEIMADGPQLHHLLQQMNRATFGQRDVLTVGETWSATPETAKLYSDPARNELSMVFQFEHITIGYHPQHGKWQPQPFDLIKLKQVFNKWQTALVDSGWNSLFWNNHDLPRIVSKYGDPGLFRVESAKMLATTLHFMQGTPYIYQGEEIGMTNVRFPKIEDYQDIESLNLYSERTEAGVPAEEMMEGIYTNGRDNARTPMQWSNEANGGFSRVSPWLKVNPNYTEINVEAALNDPDSIFFHYQKLIALRKNKPIITWGKYQQLLEAHQEVFAYQRILDNEHIVVISNFCGHQVQLPLPAEIRNIEGEWLIGNYPPRHGLAEEITLQPYESFAISWLNN
ncbi:TPA: alpha-glucosidase [Klebsiella pneumoniae]|uniref:glycoside hydrolase family 13 protein n=1 Tax=Klebsiella pneumoniae TaxID=573 RepID=UPI0013D0D4E8|nr:alpha-glucosidase [Klebsiella pneumoniae]HCI9672673.1 alpha-glucosidase [Klebsiella variicola]HBS7601978.1 alpha-glucosidase [Klebsiella pneumoniae]HBU9863499.1 alpha-glucosidase [Klebsiella pneumoniae]HBW5188500.1 alpha-glucosidase [Klebsiella pneumoniae]HBW5287160.1 alpha-glucosidase [Klebsiella pneumoniae]